MQIIPKSHTIPPTVFAAPLSGIGPECTGYGHGTSSLLRASAGSCRRKTAPAGTNPPGPLWLTLDNYALCSASTSATTLSVSLVYSMTTNESQVNCSERQRQAPRTACERVCHRCNPGGMGGYFRTWAVDEIDLAGLNPVSTETPATVASDQVSVHSCPSMGSPSTHT